MVGLGLIVIMFALTVIAIVGLVIRYERRYRRQQAELQALRQQVDAAMSVEAIIERAKQGLADEPQSHRRRRHLRPIDGGAASVAALVLAVLAWLRGHKLALAGAAAAAAAGAVAVGGALWLGPHHDELNGALEPVEPPHTVGPAVPQPPTGPRPSPTLEPGPATEPPADTPPADEQPPTWTPPATDQPAGDSGDGGNGGELPDPDPTDPPRSPTPPEPPDDPPTTPAPDPPAENGDEWHLLCLEVGLLGLPEVCLL